MSKIDESRLPTLGKRIRKIRELYDFSQEYVAKELGMSISGYSRIERDEVKITLDKLMTICQVLNLSLADLMHPNDNHFYANWTMVLPRLPRLDHGPEDFDKLEEAYKSQVQTLKEEVLYLRSLLTKVT